MANYNSQRKLASLSGFEGGITSPIAIWLQAEWGDMRVDYETYLTDFDDADLMKGLPDDL